MAGTRGEPGGRKRPQVRKVRKGGWTPQKKRKFLDRLGETCNISRACRSVRMDRSSAYRLKDRNAAFREGWRRAVGRAYEQVELGTLDRMINGTVKIVYKADGSIERTVEYPNAIALQLLKMHRETAMSVAEEHDPEEIEKVRERIIGKLKIVRKRIDDGEL